MKIGINLKPFVPGKIGGMGNYIESLIKYLPRIDSGRHFYVLYLNDSAIDWPIDDATRFKKIRVDYQEKEDFFVKSIQEEEIDFWFCPLLILDPINPGVPSAANIPDMQHEFFPEFFSAEVLAWRRENYVKTAMSADIVFTLSEYSRSTICEKLGVVDTKVQSIYLDASDSFKHPLDLAQKIAVRRKYSLADKFVFYPANTWPHKNHTRLIEAFKKYVDQFDSSVQLVLTGAADSVHSSLMDQIKQLHLVNNVKHLGHIPAADLPYIYANAECLIFPSLFEGFGIPLLEAMNVGCPVVASDIPCIREVGGEAALYFNPLDADDMCQQLSNLLSDKKLQARLVEVGKKIAGKFSYVKCISDTLASIENIYDKRSRSLPLVSIITPSYNQGRFIEATIKSVLEQGYDNLEYIIVDGGSTDEAVNIIQQYAQKYPCIRWVSEKDRGQTHAINKGIQLSHGSIVAWLNSDDTYLPGTIRKIVDLFLKNKEVKFLYGRAMYTDCDGHDLREYPVAAPFSRDLLSRNCFLCQPATFWRREVSNCVGPLNEDLHFCMDYEYWIRISGRYNMTFCDAILATSRMYSDNKTLSQRAKIYTEAVKLVKRSFGYVTFDWVLGMIDFRYNKVDRFFEHKPLSRKILLHALVCYVWFNLTAPGHLLKTGYNLLRIKLQRKHV